MGEWLKAHREGDGKALIFGNKRRLSVWRVHRRAMAVLGMAFLSTNLASAASAETMVCENPRREYVVRFDRTLKGLTANKEQYRVLAVEETKDRLVVVGLTMKGGPTFRAHFRPYKKMELFTDDHLVQTDGCR